MHKIKLLVLLFFLYQGAFAQEENDGQTDFKVSLNSYLSSGKNLPFWMTSNQKGMIALNSNNYQLIQAGFSKEFESDSDAKLDYTWGANLVAGYGKESSFQANEFWAGMRYRGITITGGAKANPVVYEGLSSTNGNIDYSNNARPIPGVTIASNGFIPIFIWKNWLTGRGVYEEKFLGTHTFTSGAHLHHKSVELRASLRRDWAVTLGINHYVLWGGTSPEFGPMPGMSQYLNYILVLKAGPGAYVDDQRNRAGNQLGNFSLEIKKSLDRSVISFYYNHLFEDQSGIEFANWSDGLYGLHVSSKDKKQFVTDFLYEFMYTLNQSGSINKLPAPTPDNPNRVTGRGKDSYFDHFIYRSFSYYNQMISTPLFVPLIGADGVAYGIGSTRMWMHHIGLKGTYGKSFNWKTLITYSRNFGTYDNSFPTWGGAYPVPLDELSILLECMYSPKKSPIQIKFGVAGDVGQRFDNTVGAYAGISYKF